MQCVCSEQREITEARQDQDGLLWGEDIDLYLETS